jgi:hypothetical protein
MYEALVSVDLGRQHDYTAVLVAEEAVWIGEPPELGPFALSAQVQESILWPGTGKTWVPPSSLSRPQRALFRNRSYSGIRPSRPPLLVRHIERVRGRSYVDVVAEVKALLARPPLTDLSVALLVDAGGVGVAVLDLMRQQGLRPYSITATGGDRVNLAAPEDIRVPKRELVAAAQICLAEGRLRISAGLEHAPTLTKELQDYRVSISIAGHDSYAAREGEHDDLVFAAAMACWFRDWYSQPYDDEIANQARRAEQVAAYEARVTVTPRLAE